MEDKNQPEVDHEDKMAQLPDANSPAMLVMFYDRWFVRSAIAAALGVLALGLFALKLWNPMPPGHVDKVRISGLDYLQAAALHRTALKQARAGNLAGSMVAWRSAIVNNPGDVDLYRGMFQTLADFPKGRREYLNYAVTEGLSLLEISRTNVNDVELISTYLARFELFDWVAEVMKASAESLTPKGARLYAEALFFTASPERFAQYWNSRERDLSSDPASVLIHNAWASFWGPPAGISAGRQALEAARKDPHLGILASKLQLKVSANISDLATFKSALRQLEDAHEDQVFDAISYWRLLQETGHSAEAIKLAKNFVVAPATPEEALRLADVFDSLGITDYCAEFLAKYTPEFTTMPLMWISRARILVKLKRWDELREIAVTMRRSPTLSRSLAGYAYYMEGFAEVKSGQSESATELFKRAVDGPFPDPVTAFRAAGDLQAFGHPELASALLKKNEMAFQGRLDFWLQLTVAAFESKDTDLLMRAAQKSYEIEPRNATAANNYAASLLVNRAKPEEAVRLTMQLVAGDPDRRDFKINHALALVLNHRYDDAAQILLRMDQSSLTSMESTLIHYAWFQIYADKDQISQASKEAAQIERRLLLGPQAKYLSETLRRFGVD